MATKNILYLASKSPSRQMLLREARIPFILIEQNADELACMTGGTIEDTVLRIAQSKMRHARVPAGTLPGELAFILTADTMVQDSSGTIHGKPKDRTDAIAKLKQARHGNHLATGFCLERRCWDGMQWITEQHLEQVVTADIFFISLIIGLNIIWIPLLAYIVLVQRQWGKALAANFKNG